MVIVLCRDDSPDDGQTKGAYGLATRTVFANQKVADEYAKGISPSREPFTIDLRQLRFGEKRGGW